MKKISWKELLQKISSTDSKGGTRYIACGDHLYVRVTGRDKNLSWAVRNASGKFVKMGAFGEMTLSVARRQALDLFFF